MRLDDVTPLRTRRRPRSRTRTRYLNPIASWWPCSKYSSGLGKDRPMHYAY